MNPFKIRESTAFFVILIVSKAIGQISVILIILIFSGCYRPPEFSEVPRISFAKLQLTDTASLVLEFNVRDGDGDIGLRSESDDPSDVREPYHVNSWVYDNNGRLVTPTSEDHEAPFFAIPVERVDLASRNAGESVIQGIDFYTFFESDTTFIVEFRDDLIFHEPAGDEYFFSETDPRTGEGYYGCEDFEIIRERLLDRDTIPIEFNGEIIEFFDDEIVDREDTVFVDRNPFHFNIYVELQLRQGDGTYSVFEFEDCDPGYTARFPVFKKGTFGRPLEGSIEYAFYSTQFGENSFLLNETLRLRFYIYDRALNQSNVVTTPDFKILELRQGPLVASTN